MLLNTLLRKVSKKRVGPHVCYRVVRPAHVHDSIRGIHGLVYTQWECKYCGAAAHTTNALPFEADCEGTAWEPAEKVQWRAQQADPR